MKKYARPLKDAGVTRINVSLDTLKADRFKDMTRIGDLAKTLEGIDAAVLFPTMVAAAQKEPEGKRLTLKDVQPGSNVWFYTSEEIALNNGIDLGSLPGRQDYHTLIKVHAEGTVGPDGVFEHIFDWPVKIVGIRVRRRDFIPMDFECVFGEAQYIELPLLQSRDMVFKGLEGDKYVWTRRGVIS